jgi:hypothetical protein
MKIIITEEQYKKIESHLTEAKSAGYDRDTQEKLGNTIRELIENISKDKSTEFVMSSGNKLILKCISDESDNFVFNVVEDTAKISKKWDTLSIQIKFGNGQDLSSEYRINKNVISTQDNGVTFDLVFIASKENGLKSKLKVNKIKTIGFSSATEPEKPEEPKTEPEQQDTNSEKETTDDDDDVLKKKAEEALAYMLNDPILKSAFYEQPTLWQLFVAELTGKETKGRGIITVTDLVKKYDDDKVSKSLNAKFIENKSVSFYPIDKIELKDTINGQQKIVVLERGSIKNYKTTVVGKKIAEGPKLKGTQDGINYELEVLSRLRDEQYGYTCYVRVLKQVGGKTEPVKKRVVFNEKSEGFQPKENNNK